MRAVKPETIQLEMMQRSAAVSTVDAEARTVEMVMSTGERVLRFDWSTGRRFWEGLSLKPEHVRMGRLNNGAPMLDAHSSWSVRSVFGVVVEGSAKLGSGELRGSVKFSKRADVEDVWQDVQDRIVRNVSLGYRIHKFEETAAGADGIPVRNAVDWEPYEISLVPMGADSRAQVRSDDKIERFPCVLITRGLFTNTADEDRLRRLRIARARG